MANFKQSTNSNILKPDALVEELSQVLPKDLNFKAHHLSTPPTITDPLCHPPAYSTLPVNNVRHAAATEQSELRPRKPMKTYCEKHFLTISIDVPGTEEQVLTLALEIYIYTTAYSTIIFVSKADSTGYLSLLKLPRGTPSPIRKVAATFIAFLVANRRRKEKQCIVNLFARAQSQYLFPGSVKNSGKHVLDDRGLVKWWCRVLNPLLEGDDTSSKRRKFWEKMHGYLVIPGLDDYETRAFLPRSSTTAANWTLGHPLEHISPYTTDPSIQDGSKVPPRCLIPMYPDDPKARFVQELEESTPKKLRLAKGWTTPKSLDQFWEMMAYRQECSSGRLTGFVWIVFDPPLISKTTRRQQSDAVLPIPAGSFNEAQSNEARFQTPEPRPDDPSLTTPQSTPAKSTQSTPAKPRPRPKKTIKRVLTGRIMPRHPQFKTHQRARFPELTETSHYYWPEEGRGQVLLDDSGYKRAVELLLHLEFGTLEAAKSSTARWINEVNTGDKWGCDIIGLRELPIPSSSAAGNRDVNDLSGMVKKKRPAADLAPDTTPAVNGPGASGAPVNTLGSGLVRKKPKLTETAASASSSSTAEQPQVNTLGAGLVRKKAKAV